MKRQETTEPFILTNHLMPDPSPKRMPFGAYGRPVPWGSATGRSAISRALS